MTEKELIEFLKKNMRIELKKHWRFEWDDNKTLTVKLYIGNEEICVASVT